MNDRQRIGSAVRSPWACSWALGAAPMVLATASAATTACAVCGKNLIKNPGAEGGLGIMSVGASGAVPGWTTVSGEFGAASYTFPNGWFSQRTKGPNDQGQELLLRRHRHEDDDAAATIGKQTIVLPAAAAGKKATLSGWLGKLREQSGPGACRVRGCRREGASEDQDRPRYDDRGHGHGLPHPERQGACRRQAGDDRRDVRRRRSRLQARRRGRARPRAELNGAVNSTRPRCLLPGTEARSPGRATAGASP